MTRLRIAVLALATAWLGACNDAQSPPTVQGALLPDSAEQMAFGVHFMLTSEGVRRAELEADTALFYDQNTRIELRKVRTIFFTEAGEQDAVLTSREGTHNVRLNSMEARGNVVVVSTDGRRLETQQLRYDPGKNEISSDSAFVLTEAERITEGVGFISDPEMTRIQVLAGARTRGQRVTIPKK